MRNLRLYNTDAGFKAHEQAAGGDGNETVSVVPGISMSKDIRKRYFNPHDGSIVVYTLAAKYSVDGSTFNPTSAPSQVKVKYVTGTTSQVNVNTPSVGGIYKPVAPFATATIPTDTAVTFEYEIDKKKLNEEYLTFQIISGGTIKWRAMDVGGHAPYRLTIQYSKNGGSWTSIQSSTGNTAPSISVSAGDVVRFRGNNASYCPSSNYPSCFSALTTTLRFNVYGNIMSLINSTEFKNLKTLTDVYTFRRLFQGCTNIVDASNLLLPATTLVSDCYARMFSGCTNLIAAPELPAKTLTNSCYYGMFGACTNLITAPELPATTLENMSYAYMFSGCTSLITGPSILPANSVPNSCCYQMFYNCTSLTTAPALPATTLSSDCYRQMFYQCTSLTTAPELPATTLENGCYFYMFYFCTGLTSAPELLATTLVQNCYSNMFYQCGKINHIKALFTTTPSNSYTQNWLYGTSSTGTFEKNPSATWDSSITRGASTVPTNWTIQDAAI